MNHLTILVLMLAYQSTLAFLPPISRHSTSMLDASTEDCGRCTNAPKCSGEYLGKGCDGTGKIQGGIATIPVFAWWPIKVFRPCPAYLAAGYQYRREGRIFMNLHLFITFDRSDHGSGLIL